MNEINLLDKRIGAFIRLTAAILIMLGHIIPPSGTGLEEMLLGADWVGVFFFFSGYGLCLSYENKGIRYRKNFVKRKALSVLIPYIAAEAAYMIIYLLIQPDWTTPYNGVLWFVPEILGCYAIFYLYMLLDEKGVNIKWTFIPVYIIFMAICILFYKDMSYIYISTHCFLAGLYLKPYLSRLLIRIVKSKYRIIIFALYWALYVLSVYCEYNKIYVHLPIKMIFILMFIPILGIIVEAAHRIPKVSSVTEKMPYYIYLWHMAVNLITKNDSHPLVGIVLCITVTIALSYVISAMKSRRQLPSRPNY